MTPMAQLWRIRGRVQGVGYRDWMVGQASGLGVAGWVRNRGDSDVEALVAGSEAAVAALRIACLRGPPVASVTSIDVQEAEAPAESGFVRRASC